MKYITAIMIILFFSAVALASYAKIVKSNGNSLIAPSVAEANFVAPDPKIVESFRSGKQIKNNKQDSLTLYEVEKHNSPSDCYMVINNNVYDVSNYGSEHPGGSSAIYDNCGKEVTGLFARIHSNSAWDLLKKYKIATLSVDLGDSDLAAIAKAFEQSNPGVKVMRISRESDKYALELTKNGVLYELLLNSDYSISSGSVLGKKTDSYIWKADKKESFFGDFDFDDEQGEYEQGEDDNENSSFEEGLFYDD